MNAADRLRDLAESLKALREQEIERAAADRRALADRRIV
jgi:hypothetical protein